MYIVNHFCLVLFHINFIHLIFVFIFFSFSISLLAWCVEFVIVVFLIFFDLYAPSGCSFSFPFFDQGCSFSMYRVVQYHYRLLTFFCLASPYLCSPWKKKWWENFKFKGSCFFSQDANLAMKLRYCLIGWDLYIWIEYDYKGLLI